MMHILRSSVHFPYSSDKCHCWRGLLKCHEGSCGSAYRSCLMSAFSFTHIQNNIYRPPQYVTLRIGRWLHSAAPAIDSLDSGEFPLSGLQAIAANVWYGHVCGQTILRREIKHCSWSKTAQASFSTTPYQQVSKLSSHIQASGLLLELHSIHVCLDHLSIKRNTVSWLEGFSYIGTIPRW